MFTPRRAYGFRWSLAGAMLAIFWLLLGCSTFESRAKEKSAIMATLDAPTQARLQAGDVRLGDTVDMVYVALGRATEQRERLTDSGRELVWVYTATWQEYQCTRLVGYRREVVRNPSTKAEQVIYLPDYQPIYVARAEDRTRVTFSNGQVVSVEQLQPAKSAPAPGSRSPAP
jgi:hypothetical protein